MNNSHRTFNIVMILLIAGAALAGIVFAGNRPPANPPVGGALVRLETGSDQKAAAITAAPLMARAAAPSADSGTTVVPKSPIAQPIDAPGANRVGLRIPPQLILQHRVQRGESLKRIASRYRITPDLIDWLNNLPNRHRITAGITLKVVQGPFRAVVSKSTFQVQLLLGDAVVETFPVGLGANGSTPAGQWRVKDKLSNPAWVNPVTRQRYAADDPANPIGEHWLGLEGLTGDTVGKLGFGIHGTIEPDSIGRNASLGCVRMMPADVEMVYQALVEGASTVDILP